MSAAMDCDGSDRKRRAGTAADDGPAADDDTAAAAAHASPPAQLNGGGSGVKRKLSEAAVGTGDDSHHGGVATAGGGNKAARAREAAAGGGGGGGTGGGGGGGGGGIFPPASSSLAPRVDAQRDSSEIAARSPAKQYLRRPERLKVIIDTDPGVDDALALLLALSSEAIDVIGVTICHGNHCDMSLMASNAIRVLAVANRLDVPVYVGRAVQFDGTPAKGDARFVHGDTLLGSAGLSPIVGPAIHKRAVIPEGADADDDAAVAFIAAAAARHGRRLAIIALGPLTNVAAARRLQPAALAAVRGVWVMGGAVAHYGNVTPLAEANTYGDPTAADDIFTAAMPVTLVPLNCTHGVTLSERYLRELAAAAPRVGGFVVAACDHYLRHYASAGLAHGLHAHDATAVMVLLQPDIVTHALPSAVRVECVSPLTRGVCVADVRPRALAAARAAAQAHALVVAAAASDAADAATATTSTSTSTTEGSGGSAAVSHVNSPAPVGVFSAVTRRDASASAAPVTPPVSSLTLVLSIDSDRVLRLFRRAIVSLERARQPLCVVYAQRSPGAALALASFVECSLQRALGTQFVVTLLAVTADCARALGGVGHAEASGDDVAMWTAPHSGNDTASTTNTTTTNTSTNNNTASAADDHATLCDYVTLCERTPAAGPSEAAVVGDVCERVALTQHDIDTAWHVAVAQQRPPRALCALLGGGGGAGAAKPPPLPAALVVADAVAAAAMRTLWRRRDAAPPQPLRTLSAPPPLPRWLDAVSSSVDAVEAQAAERECAVRAYYAALSDDVAHITACVAHGEYE